MAQATQHERELVDAEDVSFGLDDESYQIRLIRSEAEALRAIMRRYIKVASRIDARQLDRVDAGEIRQWARSKGLTKQSTGRLPNELHQAWLSRADREERGDREGGKTLPAGYPFPLSTERHDRRTDEALVRSRQLAALQAFANLETSGLNASVGGLRQKSLGSSGQQHRHDAILIDGSVWRNISPADGFTDRLYNVIQTTPPGRILVSPLANASIEARGLAITDHDLLVKLLLTFRNAPNAPDTRVVSAVWQTLSRAYPPHPFSSSIVLAVAYALVNDAMLLHCSTDIDLLRTTIRSLKTERIDPPQ